jgi:hypothetical protein
MDKPSMPSRARRRPRVPAGWDELDAFRESALRFFTQPEDLACLRHLGQMLTEQALEMARLWPEPPESETRAGLRAAAADLWHTAGVLASIGREREASLLDPADQELSALGADCAPEVERLAAAIEAVLEPRTDGD